MRCGARVGNARAGNGRPTSAHAALRRAAAVRTVATSVRLGLAPVTQIAGYSRGAAVPGGMAAARRMLLVVQADSDPSAPATFRGHVEIRPTRPRGVTTVE